jgi:hypothetical protein
LNAGRVLEATIMRTLTRFAPISFVMLLFLGSGVILYSQTGDRLAHIPEDALSDMTGIGLPLGIEAPEIEGHDIDGKWFKLSDYRGKVVVLDCWVDH